MIWAGWRFQRVETLIAAAVLAVLAAVAIPVALHAASVYSHDGLAACVGLAQGGGCQLAVPSFLQRFSSLNILFTWSTMFPAIAALLFAAPFVLDLDNGTYRLLWTQSITRRRWIVTKLALALAATVIVAGCLIVLATWARTPLDHLDGRMSTSSYDAEGLAPLADALFVLGFGVALGALWRRGVPSLLVSFVAYVVGRAFMDSWLRERLLTPVKSTWSIGGPGPNLNNALVVKQFISTKSGRELAAGPQPCVVHRTGGFLHGTSQVCGFQHPAGGAHVYMTALYQPAGRFWELQGIEFAIVGGIGLLLVVAAGWWTHRRIA